MARITALPSTSIIRGFKGTLDFYLWKGLPCVRAWPRYRASRRTEASLAAALLFGAIIRGWNSVGDIALTAYREDAADQPRAPRDIYVTGVFGTLHERTAYVPPPPPEDQMYNGYVCLRDKKAQNTNGGTFTAGAWRTRVLNDEQADTLDICTLAANQFVLEPGTYRCIITCPAFYVTFHQARLFNVTGAAVLLLGSSEYCKTAHAVSNRSHIAGRFSIAAAQTLEVQHRCAYTQPTSGFGVGATFAEEIYTIAEFWRETVV